MNTSVNWMNAYLDPPASAEEQADLLTRAGFPLEGSEEVAVSSGTDFRQDFEMTSNRGGAVCHLGLAREIAAISGRALKMPPADPKPTGPAASSLVTVKNEAPDRCPLYTARVIRGVKVGPSPQWMQDHLIARGDIPRNNVVDATNYVLFELGQPTHVFDLAKLKGSQINIRMARKDEPFLPIGEGEKEVKLSTDDLVIADAEDAVAIGGVKGGALTAVTESTTDLLLEAATFSPVTVRNTSRRLGIASDSSYRFERGVHPGQIERAANRLAALILELGGGELCEGVVADGAPIPERAVVEMRCDRCRKIIGVEIADDRMAEMLGLLGFEPELNGGVIRCRVPVDRMDIEREIDLIEEVSRMFGHDNIPIAETLEIRVAPPQPSELARQAIANELVGHGFVETITHSLVSDEAAKPFLRDGRHALRVEDDRAKAEPALQPSTIPSLLAVRKRNQDSGVEGLKLFETASVFDRGEKDHDETSSFGLLMDMEDAGLGLRPIRGVVERIGEMLLGHGVAVEVEPTSDYGWLEPGGVVKIGGRTVGLLGKLAPAVQKQFDLETPVMAAELFIRPLFENYPPETQAKALPSYPAIERDLSFIVDEAVAWDALRGTIDGLKLDQMVECRFVTAFRGKPVPKGRKSVTMRLRFRAGDRTLTHDEVDPQVEQAVKAVTKAHGAELRG